MTVQGKQDSTAIKMTKYDEELKDLSNESMQFQSEPRDKKKVLDEI